MSALLVIIRYVIIIIISSPALTVVFCVLMLLLCVWCFFLLVSAHSKLMSDVGMSDSVIDLVVCVAALTLFLFVLASSFLRRRSTKASTCPPSVATHGCPLFGHLSVLGRHPHRALAQLSRQLGPVYSLRLGRWKAVVVNGRAAVRATFLTTGRQLDDRPEFELYRSYAGGCSISFGHHGPAVRLHRRLARGVIRRLVMSGTAERIIEREAASLVAAWTDDSYHCGRCLDPADDLTMAVSSALFSMSYGLNARLSDDPEYHELLISKGANSDVFAVGKQVCREIIAIE